MSTAAIHVDGDYDTNMYRLLNAQGGGGGEVSSFTPLQKVSRNTVRIQEAEWILGWLMDQ